MCVVIIRANLVAQAGCSSDASHIQYSAQIFTSCNVPLLCNAFVNRIEVDLTMPCRLHLSVSSGPTLWESNSWSTRLLRAT